MQPTKTTLPLFASPASRPLPVRTAIRAGLGESKFKLKELEGK